MLIVEDDNVIAYVLQDLCAQGVVFSGEFMFSAVVFDDETVGGVIDIGNVVSLSGQVVVFRWDGDFEFEIAVSELEAAEEVGEI